MCFFLEKESSFFYTSFSMRQIIMGKSRCVCVGVKYTKKKYIDMGPHILHGWVTLVISTLSLKNKYWCEFWKKSQVQPTIIIHVNVIYKNFSFLSFTRHHHHHNDDDDHHDAKCFFFSLSFFQNKMIMMTTTKKSELRITVRNSLKKSGKILFKNFLYFKKMHPQITLLLLSWIILWFLVKPIDG